MERQEIFLSPVNSQGSNNNKMYLHKQAQFPAVYPTILNSTMTLPLGEEVPKGMFSPEGNSHTSLSLPTISATTIVGVGPCQTSGSYRHIPPNLSKYYSTLFPNTSFSFLTSCPSTLSLVDSTSLSSFFHIRKPGLVTVEICCSIPATLRLSSSKLLTICQASGDSATGAISPPYSNGNLESKKSSHSPPSTSSFTCSSCSLA